LAPAHLLTRTLWLNPAAAPVLADWTGVGDQACDTSQKCVMVLTCVRLAVCWFGLAGVLHRARWRWVI